MLKVLLQTASKEDQVDRLEKCNTCEHLNKNVLNTCSLCGCMTSLKTHLRKEKCPINKW